MAVCVVLAGGVGTRVGASRPKQFLEIAGKPVIAHTLGRLAANRRISTLVVVSHPDFVDEVGRIVAQQGLTDITTVVPGGPTFGHSFRNGVESLYESHSDDEVVILHMSSAPLVSQDVLDDVIDVCTREGNAFSAHPCYMCMCESASGRSSSVSLDRDLVFALNTPQAILLGRLRNLYKQADSQGYDFMSRQHLSTLLFDMGETLHFSKSSPLNIKITTRDDLKLCEGYLLLTQSDELKGSEGR
jgi:2-C-methyl-D-erythritol 4-phosphate cytidylyltransferase